MPICPNLSQLDDAGHTPANFSQSHLGVSVPRRWVFADFGHSPGIGTRSTQGRLPARSRALPRLRGDLPRPLLAAPRLIQSRPSHLRQALRVDTRQHSEHAPSLLHPSMPPWGNAQVELQSRERTRGRATVENTRCKHRHCGRTVRTYCATARPSAPIVQPSSADRPIDNPAATTNGPKRELDRLRG